MVCICLLLFQQDTSTGISSNISIIGLKLAMIEKKNSLAISKNHKGKKSLGG